MSYQFEHSWRHERERLAAIEGELDSCSIACLTAIGVGPGWRCLEVGAGAGSIARWLSERVAPSGTVAATDLETGFLETLEATNLEVRRHDITSHPLEPDSFDVVHARKVFEHLPKPEQALDRMAEVTKRVGWLLVGDADLLSLKYAQTSDRELFARGYAAFLGCMVRNGYQADRGLHLGDALRKLGPRDVQVRGWVDEWTGAGPSPSVYLRTFEKIRECAGLTDDDLRVGVPSDQRRSGQVGTESCGPGGDVRSEAETGVVWGAGRELRKDEGGGGRGCSRSRRQDVRRRDARR